MLACLAFFAAACVSGMPERGASPRDDRNTITREQMIEVNATTVYDAVQKLNPGWLSSRGPTSLTNETPTVVSVYLSGSDMGSVEFLRSLQPDDVNVIRYYESGAASVRFGMGHQRGVIEVIPRGGQ